MSCFYKLLNPDFTHNGFVYKEGLNELPASEPFNPNPACGPGGLYCADESSIWKWLRIYNYHRDLLIAEVTLCPDSQVVSMPDKYKTNKFIL